MIVAGRGRLGSSLAAAFTAAKLPAELIAGHGAATELAARFRADSTPALVFLTVPDPALKALAERLASTAWPESTGFVHVSGALGLEVLEALQARGHPIGSFHPLQSFPVERTPAAFRGSLVAVDARPPALEQRLEALATRLGAKPRRVPDQERTLYHAAAVIASNYLVVLAAQAAAVLQAAGWERGEALRALLPLMAGVLENLDAEGLPGALIGPVRRGDTSTVERHLLALAGITEKAGPVPEGVYRILGIGAVELALEAGLDPEDAKRINTALTAGAAATGR